MARMIDTPENLLAEMRDVRAIGVLTEILKGSSEDQIYRRAINLAIQVAREEGLDESDVEVIASQARSDVASILFDCRAMGLIPEF